MAALFASPKTIDSHLSSSPSRARAPSRPAEWEYFHDPEVQAHYPFAFVAQNLTPLEALGALELTGNAAAAA